MEDNEAIIKIIHIANAGFLIISKEIRILIDAIHTQKVLSYETVEHSVFEDMIMGKEPFGQINLLLFTHAHADHFDAKATTLYMQKNRNTQLIASPGVLEKLKEQVDFQDIQSRVVLLCIEEHNKEGLMIKYKEMVIKAKKFKHEPYVHNGKRYTDFENYGYLMEVDGQKVLHIGDAQISDQNFAHCGYAEENIDFALLNFPFLTLPSGRAIIDQYIRPKKVGFIHFPERKRDQHGWIGIAENVYNNRDKNFPESVLFLDALVSQKK